MTYEEREVEIERVAKDLKDNGFDFAKLEEIQGKICDIHVEYGDCPEIALAAIASGWNAKCLVEQDSQHLAEKNEIGNKTNMTAEQITTYNTTTRVQFEILEEMALLDEDMSCSICWEGAKLA